MAGTSPRPTDAQVEALVNKLRACRNTLPEDEQHRLNSMFLAAISEPEGTDEDTPAY